VRESKNRHTRTLVKKKKANASWLVNNHNWCVHIISFLTRGLVSMLSFANAKADVLPRTTRRDARTSWRARERRILPNNVCYSRCTSRNVRIISLRTITHYIPRYTVYIVYYPRYAGGKSEDSLSLSLCVPLMRPLDHYHARPRRIVRVCAHAFANTIRAHRIRARNTWHGLSNCIVNNLRKLRI